MSGFAFTHRLRFFLADAGFSLEAFSPGSVDGVALSLFTIILIPESKYPPSELIFILGWVRPGSTCNEQQRLVQ